jgi:hypothetical protein
MDVGMADAGQGYVKGWCGMGWMRFPGDFDNLDARESRFLMLNFHYARLKHMCLFQFSIT